MGRNQKDRESKERAGTYRPDRHKTVAVTLADGMPPPPAYITSNARALELYREIVNFLSDNKALADIDTNLVALAASQGAIYEKFWKEFIGDPTMAVQVNLTSGLKSTTPEYKIMCDAEKKYFDACKELGIGPKARERMLAFLSPDTEGGGDPLDKLM